MNFPENCIRGIPDKSFLINNRMASPNLFPFQEEYARVDGWIEQSINWEDDDNVIEFTLNQRKDDGKLRFSAGVAIIPRIEIDLLNSRPVIDGKLSYERYCLEDNPYHGNILLQANIPKPLKRLIIAGLCLAASVK